MSDGDLLFGGLVDPRADLGRVRAQARIERARGGEDIEGAARQFEQLFLERLFQVMRDTVPEGGLLPSSMQQDLYTELFDREIARRITSEGRGPGIASIISRQMQGREQAPTEPPSSFLWPVAGEVVRGFGEPTDEPSRIAGISTETRIAAPVGTPVLAPAAGTVVAVEHLGPGGPGLAGSSITLRHGGEIRSKIHGLANLHPRLGQTVLQGEVLGRVPGLGSEGVIGYSILEGEEPVDPLSWLRRDGQQEKIDPAVQALRATDDVLR